jgi:hypothetical protein
MNLEIKLRSMFIRGSSSAIRIWATALEKS